MQTRHIDRERYFNELASTSREFYIDYLKRFKNIDSNTRILEIGCGEGGNLLPFAESGCTVAGLDLASGKIENAGKFFASRNVKGEFACANFLTDNPFAEDGGFDIILIHDVIEHIEPDGKEAFFLRCKNYLKPDGIVFFGFPAWQSRRRPPADLQKQSLLNCSVHARAARPGLQGVAEDVRRRACQDR